MKKLLIVDSSDILAESLTAMLHRKFHIHACTDSESAALAMSHFRPECLVLNIHLPGCDGVTLLHQAAFRPAHIIALTKTPTPYVMQSLTDLGVSQVLLLPCSAQAIAGHLENMLRLAVLPQRQRDPRDIVREHLRILGFREDRDGFHALCVETALYAQDPDQSLSKELHPAAAEICGKDNHKQIEINIRRLIADAWENRNPAIWEEYFPDLHQRPNIQLFLNMLSRKLELTQLQLQRAQNE